MTLKRKLVAIAAAVVVLVVGTAGTSYALGRDKSMPACVTEDSGPNPCFWDATTRGNGNGTSFILFNGQVFRLAGTVD